MIKRTLIAIALVALLATTAQAALEEYHHGYDPSDGSWDGKSGAVKVDGTDKPTFRWPYTISYKALVICQIPIKMDIGMYVQVINCKDKKIVLQQVDCGDIGKGDDKYPCYLGCTTFDVRSNFEVKLGSALHKDSDVIKNWEAYYDGGSVVPASTTTNIKLCVKAWEAQLWEHAAGDQVSVGSVDITVKPNQ